MTDLSALLEQGAANAWVLIPSAMALGALHGLEPGHSKTMMAAFIVAVRGTVAQAILLGLSATVSHTAVVWAIALVGMRLGSEWDAEATEPYLQVTSGVLIVLVAVWMLWRTWRQRSGPRGEHAHDHDHEHSHEHHHPGEHDHPHHEAQAPDASTGDGERAGLDLALDGTADAHELAHATDIRRRFANRDVTTGQLLAFGLTGGLVPCPAAITVLVLCLQLKKVIAGATLVLGFSVGLALTMVLSGVLAAMGVQHASRRWAGFGALARKAPYLSGALILVVGVLIGVHGLRGLAV